MYDIEHEEQQLNFPANTSITQYKFRPIFTFGELARALSSRYTKRITTFSILVRNSLDGLSIRMSSLRTTAALLLLLGIGGIVAGMKLGFLSRFFERPLPPSNELASEEERQALQALAKDFPGRLVFDSNRSGSFGIYSMQPDGSDVREIYNSESEDIYPDVALDGSLIVFARAKSTERTAESSIWIMKPDGSEPRQIADNGTFPSFSRDAKTVYFERDRAKLMSVSVDGSNEKEIFPADSKDFGSYDVIKPRVSPDGKSAAFISDKKGRWNTWIADLESLTVRHLDEGCEPAWFPNGSQIAWIKTKDTKERSGMYRFDIESGNVAALADYGPPRGHEYFPTIAAGGKYLLFSSCREGEHDHISANYQIYVKDIESDQRVRVTFDNFTNRWPKLLPSN